MPLVFTGIYGIYGKYGGKYGIYGKFTFIFWFPILV